MDDELIDEIRGGLTEQSEGEMDNGLKERLATEVRRQNLDAKKKKRKMQHLKRDLKKKMKTYKKRVKSSNAGQELHWRGRSGRLDVLRSPSGGLNAGRGRNREGKGEEGRKSRRRGGNP